jgi:hypothetical protein
MMEQPHPDFWGMTQNELRGYQESIDTFSTLGLHTPGEFDFLNTFFVNAEPTIHHSLPQNLFPFDTWNASEIGATTLDPLSKLFLSSPVNDLGYPLAQARDSQLPCQFAVDTPALMKWTMQQQADQGVFHVTSPTSQNPSGPRSMCSDTTSTLPNSAGWALSSTSTMDNSSNPSPMHLPNVPQGQTR